MGGLVALVLIARITKPGRKRRFRIGWHIEYDSDDHDSDDHDHERDA